jgi:hypothetical protein
MTKIIKKLIKIMNCNKIFLKLIIYWLQKMKIYKNPIYIQTKKFYKIIIFLNFNFKKRGVESQFVS